MDVLLKRKTKMAVVACIVLTGLATGGIWFYRNEVRASTRQSLCVHNLKYVAMGLEGYAKEHDGRFPERLAALWPGYIANLQDLICPEIQAVCMRKYGVPHPYPNNPDPDTIERLSSYAYIPGYTISDPADTVIAYEKVDNHRGRGRSLLYLDGHGAWEPPENWRNQPPNKTLPPGF